MTRPKLVSIVLALVAALAVSSTAMANGGGGASWASIVDFSQALAYDVNSQPTLQIADSVYNGCVDHEKMSGVALDYSNSVDGATGRSFWALPYGPFSWTTAHPHPAAVMGSRRR